MSFVLIFFLLLSLVKVCVCMRGWVYCEGWVCAESDYRLLADCENWATVFISLWLSDKSCIRFLLLLTKIGLAVKKNHNKFGFLWQCGLGNCFNQKYNSIFLKCCIAIFFLFLNVKLLVNLLNLSLEFGPTCFPFKNYVFG